MIMSAQKKEMKGTQNNSHYASGDINVRPSILKQVHHQVSEQLSGKLFNTDVLSTIILHTHTHQNMYM